jgi:AAA domain
MTHPLFRQEIFLETAFERRFQAMLRSAWLKQSWHVIVADPGAGKTTGIRDLVRTTGSPVILAVTAPKNDDGEQALGNQFFTALGLPLRGRWSERKPKLMGAMVQFGVKCLIVDDAHDLSLEHLMFIKELTDQGILHYGYRLGLCLVTAGRGNTIPLKEVFDQPDTMWQQFRRRLDKLEPFCRVASHTSDEVREILAALETVYQEIFPHLNLHQWGSSIYTWLTRPILDPTNSGRVTMDSLMKLVTTALEWSYQAGEIDVRAETLQSAAELLLLRRNTLRIIDGAGPPLDALLDTDQNASPTKPLKNPSEQSKRQDQAYSSSHEQALDASPKDDRKRSPQPTKCSFSGIVPIDVTRFLESGVASVECPECTSLRALEPRQGILRFPSHDKRKTRTPLDSQRWAQIDSVWKVIGDKARMGP